MTREVLAGRVGIEVSRMTLEQAKEILNSCFRFELRDHYFGDREITWKDSKGVEVAYGYFGNDQTVNLVAAPDVYFRGPAAYQLVKCGKLKQVERNDEQGEDFYRGA